VRAEGTHLGTEFLVKHAQGPARRTEFLRFLTSHNNAGGDIFHSRSAIELGLANNLLQARDAYNIQQVLHLHVCFEFST
jgi:heme oxygenase